MFTRHFLDSPRPDCICAVATDVTNDVANQGYDARPGGASIFDLKHCEVENFVWDDEEEKEFEGWFLWIRKWYPGITKENLDMLSNINRSENRSLQISEKDTYEYTCGYEGVCLYSDQDCYNYPKIIEHDLSIFGIDSQRLRSGITFNIRWHSSNESDTSHPKIENIELDEYADFVIHHVLKCPGICCHFGNVDGSVDCRDMYHVSCGFVYSDF